MTFQLRSGEDAIMTVHTACFGDLNIQVSKFKVSEIRPFAQHSISISIEFIEPRKRKPLNKTVVPNGIEFVTITNGVGICIYDSRLDVPCDMRNFNVARSKHLLN
jgi:hypothetical protein